MNIKVIAALAVVFSPLAFAADTADVIYLNGNILTGEGLNTPSPQRVSALALRDGKVMAVGSDADIQRYKGAATQVIDLHKAFVMPGFNDAHIHLASGGFLKLSVDLTGVTSLEDMQARIRKAASAAAPGTWLQGFGWDHTAWKSQQLPTRTDIDAVTGNHPAMFERIDGHIAVANTAALKSAGIIKTTTPPQGGQIDRDATGEATGILRESAMDPVKAKIPPLTAEQRRKAMELACAEAVSWGVTTAQDGSEWGDFAALQALEREGRLPLRVTEWLQFGAPLDTLNKQRAARPKDDPLLRIGMLKGFMDGSLGSRTAAMLEPYTDDPTNKGLPQYEQPQLDALAIPRARAGFQLGFHAIGDRAVSMALDAFTAALANKAQPQRFRVEHVQVVHYPDFARFAKLGAVASMQPNHLLTDMNWAGEHLGPKRARYSYPWRSMLDHKVVLAFGTDYPVEPVTPFRGLYAAVTRKNEAGTKTYVPEEKLSIYEALYAYTQGSAYAENMESRKGKLTAGQFADLVVLDRDVTRVTPEEILKTKVLRTVVGGKTVYKASPASSAQR